MTYVPYNIYDEETTGMTLEEEFEVYLQNKYGSSQILNDFRKELNEGD